MSLVVVVSYVATATSRASWEQQPDCFRCLDKKVVAREVSA